MTTRKVIFAIFLIIFTGLQFLFPTNLKRTLSINWGKERKDVGIFISNSDYIGPSGIKKLCGRILIGDRVNGKIVELGRDIEILRSLPENLKFFTDFYLKDEKLYILKGKKIFILNGKSFRSFNLPAIKNDLFIKIFPTQNGIWAITGSEKSFLFSENGKLLKVKGGIYTKGSFYFIKLEKEGKIYISISDENGFSQKFEIPTPLTNLNSATFIGKDNRNNVYLKVTSLIRTNPIKNDYYILKISKYGKILNLIKLPYIKYALVNQDILPLNQEEMIILIPEMGKLSIYKLSNITNGYIDLSKNFEESYHFRDFIPRFKSKSQIPMENPPVYRDESLSIAYSYANLNWYASSCNITSGTYCGGKTVSTPSWVDVGSQDKVPYKWGGFSSIEGFLQGIENCEFAGDNNCTGGGSDCAVGVDCSGFVSRCWKTSQKYGTSTFSSVSHEISPSQLLPGDAYNDPGSHIRLFVRRNPDGSVNCVESHGGSWCVEYTYYSSDPDGYTPIRYDNMAGYHKNGTGSYSDPIIIDNLPYQDSNSTASGEYNFNTYSCAPGTDESGPEIYYKLDLNFVGNILVSVSDGSGVDVDPHILTELSQDSCVARGDTTATYDNAQPGTYYIVADTWVNSSGTIYSGNYTITIDVSSDNCGTFENPFIISSFPFTHNYSTFYSHSDQLNYYSCANSTNESGPEVIYKFSVNCSGTITVSVEDSSTTDIDIHLLNGESSSDCLIRDDSTFSYHISPGTYYIVADTYVDSSGNEKKGDYKLTVDFQGDNTDSDGDGIVDCEDPEPNVKHGDINNDGNVDMTDTIIFANFLAGNLSEGEGECKYPLCGDLNLDEKLNGVDLTIYLNYNTGNISNIPYN